MQTSFKNPIKLFWGLSILLAVFVLSACTDSSAPEAVISDTPATSGYTLIERVAADSSEIVIPYSKYELGNGLTVIIHEDNSDPLVHVDVTYHVGSEEKKPVVPVLPTSLNI